MLRSTPRLVVIGGGITGLAAARAALDRCQVTLLESAARIGGLVQSERTRHGFVIEHGPDSIVTAKPAGIGLARKLGLEEEIVRTKSSRSYVQTHGDLVQLPAGLFAMSPDAGWEMLRSPLFSMLGKGRMLLEPLAPRGKHPEDDESVGSFFGRRLGREFVDRIVDPLLGGIYGGDADRLSMRVVMPQMMAMEQRHGSIALGMARMPKRPPSSEPPLPPLISFRHGMGELTDQLARELGSAVRTGVRVAGVRHAAGGEYRVRLSDGTEVEADAVVITTPAWHAAPMIEGLDASLASMLASIGSSRIDAVTFAWPRWSVPHTLDGTGFVVPRSQNRRLRACTWTSEKWPFRAPEGVALLRAFVRDAEDADDQELIETARRELRETMGIEHAPRLTRVTRKASALPRYEVGHQRLVTALRERAAAHPGLALAGNAFGGVGIPDCVSSGEAAVETALAGVA